MKDKQPLSERLLFMFCIASGAMIVVMAFVFAIRPDGLYSPGNRPSDVQLKDYQLGNFGSVPTDIKPRPVKGLVTTGTHDSEFNDPPAILGSSDTIYLNDNLTEFIIPDRREPSTTDDEKTSGTTNQLSMPSVFERRHVVPVEAQDLMDIDPPAPIQSVTPTHGH